MATDVKARSLFDGPIAATGPGRFVPEAHPAVQVRNPVMFVVFVGSILTRASGSRRWSDRARRPPGSSSGSRCGCGSRCSSRTSPRRSPRGAARPRRRPSAGPARTSRRNDSNGPSADAKHAKRLRQLAPEGRRRAGRGRRRHSRGRGSHRGRGVGGRERDHRGERARDPRERGRPQRGHRRDAGPVGLADRPHQRESRRGLPRPHDRHGRGRQAPEDAERDRAQHPAGGFHHHLPAGHRHAAAVFHLQRRPSPARERRSR